MLVWSSASAVLQSFSHPLKKVVNTQWPFYGPPDLRICSMKSGNSQRAVHVCEIQGIPCGDHFIARCRTSAVVCLLLLSWLCHISSIPQGLMGLCHWLYISQIRYRPSWEKQKSFTSRSGGWKEMEDTASFPLLRWFTTDLYPYWTPGCCCQSWCFCRKPTCKTKRKSTQSEQDMCSDNLWTPSHALVTTSSWTVIPSWHATGQGFSTAHSLLRKPQHICSVACAIEHSLHSLPG